MQHPWTVALSAVAAAACFLPGSIAKADELPALPVVPSQTKILLLPTLDETGDRPEMQVEHVNVGNHRLEYELLTRGFQVIGPDQALRTARADDIDLDDSDERGRANLRQLGKDTGADWVVSLAIIDVTKQNKGLLLFHTRRGQAKVQLKVFDMHQNGWIANRMFEDTKTTTRVLGTIGTTGLFKDAIDTTVQRCISNLLAPYPQTITIGDEFGEDDLLAGHVATPNVAAPVSPAAPADNGADTSAPTSSEPAPTAPATAAPAAATPDNGTAPSADSGVSK